jgi:Kef-type K+ transport system membrane component KefB
VTLDCNCKLHAGGLKLILRALGVAAVKAVICVSGIIIAGRTLLRPVFRRINAIDNDELFAATTLLVVLGSSVLTQIAGLSQALGAFLAGLLMAETEYALQVRDACRSQKQVVRLHHARKCA